MSEQNDENLDDTFQEPRKRFWQRSSRKRTKSDVISVSSMDISHDSSMIKRKKRKRLTEFATSLLSSTSTTRLSSALHRSLGIPANNSVSIVEEDIDAGPNKRTASCREAAGSLTIRSWLTDVAQHIDGSKNLSKTAIKRQEGIYELYCGENVLLNDLQILKQFYQQPLQETDIFTQSELRTLFGDLDMLIHVHCKLRDDLLELRDLSGFTDTIGSTLLEWLPSLTQPYVERCRSQIFSRHILDEKRRRSKKFQEFIKKKMELPRSIDLWTYLDMPRSRIVKYPILVNEILRRTSGEHDDYLMLKDASTLLKKLLDKINRAMGSAECELARMKINIKDNNDSEGCIKIAKELITEGELEDSKGLKFYCFLFDTCLALTRRVPRSRLKTYNLVQPIIPKCQLKIDKNYNSNICGFKIQDRVLIVRDEHDKRHWLDSFTKINRLLSTSNKKKSTDSCNKNEESSPIIQTLRKKQTSKRTVRERPI